MRPRASCLPPFTHGYITWFSSCGSLPSCRSPYSLPNCSTVCEGVKRMNNTRNNMGERRDRNDRKVNTNKLELGLVSSAISLRIWSNRHTRLPTFPRSLTVVLLSSIRSPFRSFPKDNNRVNVGEQGREKDG